MYFVCSSRSTDFQLTTCTGPWSVAGRTKISTEVDMWRWSDSLNFLRAGDFGRTRPLSVPAFSRVDSSMAFERRDDRSRADRLRAWHSQPSWTATLKTIFCCAFGCSKYDKHRKDGVSFHRFTRNEEFRRRLLCGCSATSIAAETAKICRKNTNNGEWTIHRLGKEAQVAKNKSFPLTCWWGRH